MNTVMPWTPIHFIRGDGKTACRLAIEYYNIDTPPSLAVGTSSVFGQLYKFSLIGLVFNDYFCPTCLNVFKERIKELHLEREYTIPVPMSDAHRN